MFDAGAITARLVLDAKGFYSGIQKAQAGVKSAGEGIKDLGQSVMSTSQKLGRIASTMTFIGAGITAPFIMAFKSVEKYSSSAKQEIDKFGNTILNLRMSIADSLTPIIQRFNNILADLTQRWLSLSQETKDMIVKVVFMGGVFLTLGGIIGTVVLKVAYLSGAFLKLIGSMITGFASLNAPMLLIVIGIGFIIAAMLKWKNVSIMVFNAVEIAFNYFVMSFNAIRAIFDGIVIAITKYVAFILGIFEKLPTPFKKSIGEMRKSLDDFSKGAQEDFGKATSSAINSGKTIGSLFTKEGNLSKGITDFGVKVKDIGGLFDNLGQKVVNLPNIAENFKSKVGDTLKTLGNFADYASGMLSQFFSQTETLFSDVLYNVFTGQFENIQQAFADFGNNILKMLSQLVIKMLMIKMIYMPLASAFGIPIGAFGGFQDGTEEIPSTGMYRLHGGEKITPRYDAAKNETKPLTIYNLITNEAIAMAMASKEGAGVIVNTINLDSLRNGVTRREVKNR